MQISTSNIVEGNNPRRYYDSAEMDELVRSIRVNGIIQPIAVRKEGDKYIVVAGHRRFKAAQTIGLTEVPSHIVDGDAEVIALAENTVRADMSPAEESDAAMSILKKLKGDLTEAALHLGWTEDKLRRRLALAACSKKVRDALAERKIKLGIAELLASVPDSGNQDKALEKIIANNLTVAEVRNFLSKLTQRLDKAIFDLTECNTCQFNTAVQSSLFAEVVAEDTYCTNGACYARKTTAAAQNKADALKEEFQEVRVISMDDSTENFTKLTSEGGNGVGLEQFKACHNCAKFGAVVWLTPGHEGSVEQDICFDLTCHADKVATAHPAIVPVSAGLPVDTDNNHSDDLSMEMDKSCCGCSDDDADPELGETSQSVAECTTATSVHPDVGHYSQALVDYRRTLWNKAGVMTIAANPQKGLPVVLALIAQRRATAIDSKTVNLVLEKYAVQGDFTELCIGLDGSEKIHTFVAAAASSSFNNLTHEEARAVLRYLRANLGDFWTINADYLNLLTKTQIKAVVEELGIDEKVDGKIFSGKKEAIIQAIMESGMDFTGLVPQNMQY